VIWIGYVLPRFEKIAPLSDIFHCKNKISISEGNLKKQIERIFNQGFVVVVLKLTLAECRTYKKSMRIGESAGVNFPLNIRKHTPSGVPLM